MQNIWENLDLFYKYVGIIKHANKFNRGGSLKDKYTYNPTLFTEYAKYHFLAFKLLF